MVRPASSSYGDGMKEVTQVLGKQRLMRRVLWLVGVLLCSFVAVGYLRFRVRRERQYPTRVTPAKFVVDAQTVARGAHLARTFGGCAKCHGADFGGQVMGDDVVMRLVAPNLTKGKGSAVRAYAEEDWMRVLVHGVAKNGRSLLVMPCREVGSLADEDLAAIVSYLRSVPSVDRELQPSKVTLFGQVLFGWTEADVLSAELIDHEKRVSLSIAPGPTRAYGEYLVAVCKGCHGLDLGGGIVIEPGAPPSADISKGAMASWTFEAFERALRQGKRRDGTTLDKAMPWSVTKHITADEMRAVWLALRQE